MSHGMVWEREVAVGVTGGERPIRRSRFEDFRSERDSNWATKGSSS